MNIGYVRTSTTLQDNSVETQKETLENYCKLYKINLDKVYLDFGVSGKTFDRDEFNQLIERVKQGGIRQIMVSELSRLGRNMLELLKTIETLKEHNTNLIVIKEGIDLSNKSSELFIHLLGVLSSYELSLLKDRISSVLKTKKNNLKPYCREVYGFDRVGDKLVPNQVEQRMIKKVLMLRTKKDYSYGQIVTYLQKNKYKSKKNTDISRNSVVGIVKNHSQNNNYSSIN